MRKLLIVIFGIFLLVGCQKPFESKDQAKNEVNKNGYRTGRWVDYYDANSVRTNDGDYNTYVLSEYKDGKPVGDFKTFYKDNSIKRRGTFKIDETLYEKNTMPSNYTGKKILYRNNEVVQKQEFDSDGDLLKNVVYFKNENTNSRDSAISKFEYYSSKSDKGLSESIKSVKKISLFNGEQEIMKLDFLETSYVENMKKFDEFYNIYIQSLDSKSESEDLKRRGLDDNLIEIFLIPYNVTHSKDWLARGNSIWRPDKGIMDFRENYKSIYEKFLHQNESTSPYNENNNNTNNQGIDSNENGNKSKSNTIASCTCLDISDNPESYIGKTVQIELVYLDTKNSMVSLKMRNYRSEESLNTSMNIGLYDVDNDTYYFRIASCNGGIEFYLQIPYSISSKLPNVTEARILVTGVLKNKNTIIVKSIRR